MKILVVETSTRNHLGMLENWELLADKNGWKLEFHVSYDFLSEAHERLSVNSVKFVNSWIKILLRVRDYDLVVLNTAQSNFLFLFVLAVLSKKIVITIHNVNRWFEGFRRSLQFRDFDKKVSFLFVCRKFFLFFFSRLMLSLCGGVVVNSKNMQRYLNGCYELNKPQVVIPFSLKQRDSDASSTNFYKHKVVYPGQVDCVRKNYDLFLKLAADFPEIEFVLLGKIDIAKRGRQIVERIQIEGLTNLKYYSEYVSQEEFSSQLLSASLLFSNINVSYRNEVYGVSKDTGVSYLMAEYGLPLIVNNDFKNLEGLTAGTIYYGDGYDELKTGFARVVNDELLYSSLRKSIFLGREEIGLDLVASSVSEFVGAVV